MTSRLLIVEDDPEITSALVRGLALHGYEAEAENRADRALSRLTAGIYSGAIVDVMLGSDSGVELVRTARAHGATLPILMLSALSGVEDRATGLAAGADDYVVKPFHFDELVARLRVQEHRALAQRVSPARLIRTSRRLEMGPDSVTLTEREFDLLALLIRSGEDPQPRSQLHATLWAAEGASTENVVDVYVGYLRRKLETADFGFEIKTVRNRGFCISGRRPELLES
ncbi:two component transcriptional regulator [Dinoroseobacter shibae DFL 12 = DSM 16493]|jgi:DNA-binding response OmpR family regulator|uniref:Two component transcriptional regulator n=1 Tax=Dinoroseobacter shibae (strain DSM 16493 / NCIMB 14021 / DFL 12) TaxID=398580 RepID=A8LN53_DINSH|nr:response regulator transcription factor [Dinoroseobacter shibae]ABV92197.1 two component transcriptional regulator [Dinoroseobacter shibae DFL 12 = DSM 16493]URF47151.1 response regulator transcription factor [Dinoroseobacter shibae]URF51462.1 response regulator transcription factor [Dinoroseobacter shibae]